jgi:serine protease Do
MGPRHAGAVPLIALAIGFIVAVVSCAVMPEAVRAASPQETIAGAARKVVKIHGAGGVRGLESYQTGILVSPAGHIVTVMSTVLDADELDCVLDVGRRYRGRVVGVDARRELAVLSIDAEELPAFTLGGAAAADGAADRVPVGTRIFALSNLFGVAVGDERVSAQHGVVSAVVPLAARRGAYEVPYRGDVYILDCTTNNPGSPGGAVVDWRGRLVGMLGKELRSSGSGIWLNYAVPAAELAAGYQDIVSGTASATVPATGDAAAPNGMAPGTGFDPTVLGMILVPDLLDRTPPFIESVAAESPAARAGLRADDLVIAVGGQAVASRAAVQQALAVLATGDPVRLAVVRDGAIVECDLGPRPAAGRKR